MPLFTSERLFGSVASSDLTRHAVFLERAKAEAGRDEAAVRLALGAYLVARLVDGYFASKQGDASDHSGLLWQANAVRRQVSELPCDAAETNHLVGIAEAVPVGAANGDDSGTLRISLTAYAYFLEHETRLEAALEILALAARAYGKHMAPVEFATCGIFAGRLNRLLARWSQALTCYSAAEEAARAIGDPSLVLRAQLGRGAVCRGQGNLPMARTIAQGVAEEAERLQLTEVQAIASADLGFVLNSLGLRVEGLQANYRAFLLTPDPIQRMRTLGDLGIDLLEIGAHGAARLAFEIVIGSKATHIIRTNAVLELMDLESMVGNRVAFERCRTLAESSRERMPPSMVTDYLYKMGTGLARFGQHARARDVLASAIKVAESHGLNAWYFKIEQTIQKLETEQQQVQTQPVPEEFAAAPVIEEMEVGLREFAALQPA